MNTRAQLLALLSQGGFHSGEQLAQQLGISRAGVWKQIQSLHFLGLSIDRIPGRGYRLPEQLELLCPQRIHAGLHHEEHPPLQIQVFDTLESTNLHLMHQAQQGAPSGLACLAEHQSNGRGRRGRAWASPLASNLYISLLWRFNEAPNALSALPLCIAVAICHVLEQNNYHGIRIKWPNDLLHNGKKLGGILMEMSGDPTGRCYIVVGIGLNVNMLPEHALQIDQPWTSLRQLRRQPPSRNQLSAAILSKVASTLHQAEHGGITDLITQWRQRDAFADQPVKLLRGEQHINGIARGIDDEGNLLLETNGSLQRFHSGEISLRAAQ